MRYRNNHMSCAGALGAGPLWVAVALAPCQAAAADVAAPAAVPAEAAVPVAATEAVGRLNITLGKSQLVNLQEPVSRVAVGNPGVADVKMLNLKQVYVLGTGIGSTNVLFWNKVGDVLTALDVSVNQDVDALNAEILGVVKDGKVTVRAVGNHVVLEGRVPSLDMKERVKNLATAFGYKDVLDLLSVDRMPSEVAPPRAPSMDQVEVLRGTAKSIEQFKAKE